MSAGAYATGAQMGLQMWAGVQQANMIRRQSQLTEKIDALNAKYAEYDAYEAEKFGFEESARYEGQVQQTTSSQRAAMAAEDVDVNYGTAAELAEETKLNGFLNVIDIQAQARARALGIKREANSIRLNSSMKSLQAQNNASAAQMSGFVGAATTAGNYVSRRSSGY